MAPMAAEQAAGADPVPCRNGPAVHSVTKAQEPAKATIDLAAARPAGGTIFTEQLWKTVGLVPKQLGRASVQCAANCVSPKTLARASTAGSLARLMSGGSSFGGDGLSNLSHSGSAGAISANMAPECINPKTLKMAAIMAWEAGHTEASDISGAMSDSTGVSPSGFHPVGCSSSWDHGSDRSGGGATGGGQGYRQSSLGPGWSSGGWGPGGVPNPTDGYSSAFGGGGAQSRLHSLGARSDTGGSSDTAIAAALAAADPADLLECLFCGVATCLPNGPSTVKCSDCQAPMHKECFVAHYHVVPGRRDWTYCPTHAVAPKNQVPAKPHEKPPNARAAKVRRTAKRFRGDDGDETAAARSQRRRRNPEGIAAARRRAKLSDSDAHADIGSPSSSNGGGSGHRSLPPAMQRPRRARAVNYAAMDGAVEDEDGGEGDARTSGSAAAEDDAPPYRRFELPAPPAQQQIAPLSRVVPGSPDSNAASESGSAAQPGSPAAAAAVRDPAQDSPPAPLPAMSVNVRRPRQTQQPNMSDAAAPETPVAQSAAAAANGVRSPRSPPSRRPPAAAASAGPASPWRATPRKAPVQVAAAAEVRTLAAERQKPKSPPAKSAADLADEELAMQLHQELNASSRRRGMRGPSTTIATTPGSMQALDGA